MVIFPETCESDTPVVCVLGQQPDGAATGLLWKDRRLVLGLYKKAKDLWEIPMLINPSARLFFDEETSRYFVRVAISSQTVCWRLVSKDMADLIIRESTAQKFDPTSYLRQQAEGTES